MTFYRQVFSTIMLTVICYLNLGEFTSDFDYVLLNQTHLTNWRAGILIPLIFLIVKTKLKNQNRFMHRYAYRLRSKGFSNKLILI